MRLACWVEQDSHPRFEKEDSFAGRVSAFDSGGRLCRGADPSFFPAVEERKSQGAGSRRLRGRDGDDVDVAIEHAAAGLRGGAAGNLPLADSKEDAEPAMGTGDRDTAPGDGHEGAGVVPDRSHRLDGRVFRIPSSGTSRSIHSAFQRLVAGWHQGRVHMGLGHVGCARSICGCGRDRRACRICFFHCADFTKLREAWKCAQVR